MKAKDLDKIFDDGEVDINDYLDLSSANKPSKELVNLKIAYEQGVLSGFTKSIVLIRHLQRTYNNMNCEQEILKEAMELIAENIETNNENNR